jgi:hypothetical protein
VQETVKVAAKKLVEAYEEAPEEFQPMKAHSQ